MLMAGDRVLAEIPLGETGEHGRAGASDLDDRRVHDALGVHGGVRPRPGRRGSMRPSVACL